MARPRKQAVVPAAAAPVAAEPLVPNGAVAAQQPPLAAIKKATEHLDDGKRELWLIQLPRNVPFDSLSGMEITWNPQQPASHCRASGQAFTLTQDSQSGGAPVAMVLPTGPSVGCPSIVSITRRLTLIQGQIEKQAGEHDTLARHQYHQQPPKQQQQQQMQQQSQQQQQQQHEVPAGVGGTTAPAAPAAAQVLQSQQGAQSAVEAGGALEEQGKPDHKKEKKRKKEKKDKDKKDKKEKKEKKEKKSKKHKSNDGDRDKQEGKQKHRDSDSDSDDDDE